MLYEELTSKIIGAFYKVYNTLLYGFLEKFYKNSLKLELLKSGLKVKQQKNITVCYDSNEVALLFNFGKEPKFVRKVYSYENKKSAMIR